MQKNNRSKTFFSVLVFSFLLFVVSCRAKEVSSPLNIPNEFLNQQIQVRVASYSNTFKNADPVSLELKYNSNNVIVFPNNYNLKIFEFRDGSWIETQEKPTERFPPDDIVLAPDKVLPAVQVVVSFPHIKDVSSAHRLRFYVIGEMQTDDGNQMVAAYADVELKP